MSTKELHALRLIAVIFVGLATFQAASGRWVSSAAVLGLLLVFSVGVALRSKKLPAAQEEPEEAEARIRRNAARVMPLLLVLFIGLIVHDLIDEDWAGAGYAAFCVGVVVIALYLNRRWLSEARPRPKA